MENENWLNPLYLQPIFLHVLHGHKKFFYALKIFVRGNNQF